MRPTRAIELIRPCWDAPPNVQALTSTRRGGVSAGEFASLNLAGHVADKPEHVAMNRALLCESLSLPTEPVWLTQVHGCRVVDITHPSGRCPTADACVSRQVGQVCAIMTADCLPVLLCDDAGRVVAAAHAGWRGLLHGVIETAVAALGVPPGQVHAWLGPAIGPDAFEVGPEVREQFCAHASQARDAFVAAGSRRWFADLYLLARQRLAALDVERVSGGEHCTFSDQERFFSYRRDGRTGRMASLIWLSQQADS
ncbi:MAG TPA: peptidoglycan editing factor PgeF [Chromatiaceae bacterium]|nr:MAG: peptidoglycan editing factor PgeF [Thiohalocapsa sp. PB-PSB1]HBG94577.1 peptidoglycan editing factor PgeF [Chromatiaceae bacterium]HCS89409.1 peptidoglycan editing factor PgeF [Chromatiaceae bacterium]